MNTLSFFRLSVCGISVCVGLASIALLNILSEAASAEDARQKQTQSFLTQLDKNGNGTLELEEWKRSVLTDRFVGGLAKTAGLDTTQPIAIDKLVQAAGGGGSIETKRSSESAGSSAATASPTSNNGTGSTSNATPPNSSVTSGSSNASSANSPSSATTRSSNSTSGSPSSVPGFNSSAKLSPVGGFGTKADPGSSSGTKPNTSSSGGFSDRRSNGSSGSTSGSSGDASDIARYKEHAAKFIKMYDKDGDGMLKKESDEWKELKDSYKLADANKDNVLTTEELAVSFASFARGDKKESSSSSDKSSGNSVSSSGSRSSSSGSSGRTSSRSSGSSGSNKTQGSQVKSYRQTSPTDRLPKGLPDWFLRNDADGDGQIMMAEFSASWSEAKAAEFISFDIDGDGFITSKECLKKLEGK